MSETGRLRYITNWQPAIDTYVYRTAYGHVVNLYCGK